MVYDVVYIVYIYVYISYIKWKHLKLSLIWYIVIFDGHIC